MHVGNSIKQNKIVVGVNSVVYPWLNEKLCHFLFERKLFVHNQCDRWGNHKWGREKRLVWLAFSQLFLFCPLFLSCCC